MRAGNALLVAGIAIIVAALSGVGFAAEVDEDAPPEAEVAPAAPAPEPAPAEPATPEPAGEESAGEGRVPPEVETEPVESGGDERRPGDAGRKGEEDRAGGDEDRVPLANVDVDMKGFEFKPKTVTIAPGDEVTWENFDTAQHNAVGQGSADFETPLLEKGETATEPFNDAGTFDYICTVHPEMKGKVVVQSSGSGDSSGGGGTNGNTGSTTGSTDTTSTGGSIGTGSTVPSSSGSSSGGATGSLPNTGGVEVPLLLFGSALIVIGLLARAFHEYWIWR